MPRHIVLVFVLEIPGKIEDENEDEDDLTPVGLHPIARPSLLP
jgi:hypothetical protein